MQLNTQEMARRLRVENLKLSARTLAEIGEAKEAIRAWRAEYPNDLSIFELGERLAHAEDFANEREATATALGLNEAERREREQILVRCDRAGSSKEAQQARTLLLSWLARCPADKENMAPDLKHLNRTEALYAGLEADLAEYEAQESASVKPVCVPQLVAAG